MAKRKKTIADYHGPAYPTLAGLDRYRRAPDPDRHAYGPAYPTLAGLDRYRRAPDPDRHAYGAAVMAAIRALQARELARELPSHPCPCASGVWASDGQEILRAVRAQNRRG